MASSVASTSFISWRLAPSTATPSGIPWPSVSTRRVVPSLPRSVGFLPTFSPPKRCLGHRTVHRLPFPLESLPLIVQQQSLLPAPRKHTGLPPLLTPVMHRTGCPQAPRQRFPLAAGAQHIHDGGHRLPVSHPGPALLLPGFGRGENAHHLPPQGIGNLIRGAYPKGVLAPPGFLLSDQGRTLLYCVHDFSDRLLVPRFRNDDQVMLRPLGYGVGHLLGPFDGPQSSLIRLSIWRSRT